MNGGCPEAIEKGDSDEDFVKIKRKRKGTGELTENIAGSDVDVSGQTEGDANAEVAFDANLTSIMMTSMMMMMMIKI